MGFDVIVGLVKNIIDVLIVWLVLYFILKSLSKNLKMVLLFKGIVFILLLKILRKFSQNFCISKILYAFSL